MTSSLHDARDERGTVVAVERLTGGMVELSVRLPHLAATALPGQFAQLRCSESLSPLLRRPFSVAWTHDDIASFVLAPVGVGTRLLAAMQPGDELAALGPLGHGYSVDSAPARAVCVAGGLGCAPFPLLVRALRRRGVAVTVVNGAASAPLLYPAERFRRGDGSVVVTEVTVDGSAGARGLVTDVLDGALGSDVAVYACGPNAMLAALARRLADQPPVALAEVSLEAPMGCGYGTCLGCALPVVDAAQARAWALCCRDGPVMSTADIDWAALVQLPPAHVA